MNKFWIIAKDVYLKNVKSLSFVIMILVPFIVMGIIYLAGTFMGDSKTKIGLVSNDPMITKQLTSMKSEDYSFKEMKTKKEAQKSLNKSDIEAFLVISMKQDKIDGKMYAEKGLGSTSELIIQQVLNAMQSSVNASKLKLSQEQVLSLSEPANFEKIKVSFNDKGEMKVGQDNTGVQTVLSGIVTVVMFMIIMSYSSIVAQEIASEKGSRIMEVIVSSTKAQTHFYGKLVGVFAAALTQILIYVFTFVLGYSQLKKFDVVQSFVEGVSFNQSIVRFLVFTFLFFFFGVFAYSSLAALCGSLVSKPEDSAKAVQPIMYVAMIGYVIGFSFGLADPQNIVVKVASYIPFISSIVMPIRLATETVTFIGALISIALLIIFTLSFTMLSAKLYKSNVLVYNEGGVFKSLQQSISILKNERKKIS